ncbi:CDP-glycerol glycerophosphotransferase [Bacillus sp. SORGH_AS 510]|uniref:CDP-glycerol glycerophosphotransferase family protein n=1 Tax=Bacillus sp. SORGH_AS_0510 TaxID=3041771 RepID=UPI00278A9557|nr:CDP-glycerol glycerophosphotransferase family protein [Bacillus sp. SORGH_AS_0510]MDQ1144325.1 CDP-glycerol glycerophosphotransferase [Bacillus sp. SORGH_AS_0510]
MILDRVKSLLKKNKNLYKSVFEVYTKIKEFMEKVEYLLFFHLFKLFPICSNKIVFSSYYGNGYGDHSKYIAEEIINSEANYEMVWLLKKDLIHNSDLPPNIRAVKYGSIRAIYEMVTAKIWIDNCRKSSYVRKRDGQFYIQTWHGGISLKQIEKDAEANLSISYLENAKNDSRIANLFISNSKFCTKMYRSAFWYSGEILECGSPRCDILLNKKDNVNEKVRSYFGINSSKHILMYAPTFRTDSNTNVYDIDYDGLIKVLERNFGGSWVVLVRLHPNVAYKENFIEYSSTIINATDYNDMYELLAVSDILITDYSSTMFEFSFTNKPVLLYATDIETYIKDRSFYFDIHSLPYPLAQNNQQLFSILEQFDEIKYTTELRKFLSSLELVEQGTASKEVVEIIGRVTNNKND